MTIDHKAAVAFRLGRQRLVTPTADLVGVASAVAMRNSPPGSAVASLHARVADLEVDALDRALADKELVELWCVRASPCVVAPADLAVFTVGLLPDDEAAMAQFLVGFGKTNTDMLAAVERTTAAVCEALDGRVLAKSELSAAVTALVPPVLAPFCKPCGVNHVSESLLRTVGLRGVLCMTPRQGVGASFARLDQWVGWSPEGVDVPAARAEAVRRFLRWYGPSDAKGFASWAGIAAAQGKRWWALVADEVVPVEGVGGFVLADDVADLEDPPQPQGVRLLPPADPYLLQPDRATLVPDANQQKVLWRAISSPGAVLVDGEVAGAWRAQKQGTRLVVTVEPFVAAVPVAAVEEAAAALAPLRGCTAAEVHVA